MIVGGCVDSSSVVCDSGALCPAGTVCVLEDLCVDPAQLGACKDHVELELCGDGEVERRCYGGVCLDAGCGNGRLDADGDGALVANDETCDDGNNTPGDGCSADCTSDETCGNGTTDLINGEVCDDGNQLAHDGCAGCRSEPPAWSVQSTMRMPTDQLVAVYDAHRDRIVVFAADDGESFATTVWEWDGYQWSRHRPSVSPTPRRGHAMAYDHAAQRVVLFGGAANAQVSFDDTWEWNGIAWTLRQPPV